MDDYHHPHQLIKPISSTSHFTLHDTSIQEHLIIVSELLKDNLYEFGKYLKETDQPSYFTLDRLRLIMRQCLEALSFIHALDLIHCDIKVKKTEKEWEDWHQMTSSCFPPLTT